MTHENVTLVFLSCLIVFYCIPIWKKNKEFEIIQTIVSRNAWRENFMLAQKHWKHIARNNFAQLMMYELREQAELALMRLIVSPKKNTTDIMEMIDTAIFFSTSNSPIKDIPKNAIATIFKDSKIEAIFHRKIISEIWVQTTAEKIMIASLFFSNDKSSPVFVGTSLNSTPFRKLLREVFTTIGMDVETIEYAWKKFSPEQKAAAAKIVQFFELNDVEKFIDPDDGVAMESVVDKLTELVRYPSVTA